MISATETLHNIYRLEADIHALDEAFKANREKLVGELSEQRRQLGLHKAGLDQGKINMARMVVYVRGAFRDGGKERQSCINDAIQQLSTGAPVGHKDLWREYFGTKNYDAWYGQRSDHSYFMGPRHGSIVFAIGIVEPLRKGVQADLTPEQVEAAVYLLLNLEAIQDAERLAA